MLKNENIICISSIDWDFIWQGHQEIMSAFAGCGNRVLFIENTGIRPPGLKDIPRIKQRIKNWLRGIQGIRKERENLYIFSPLVVPFPYLRLARWINRRLILSILNRWSKVMDFSNPIIWTFLPTGLSLDIISNISKKAAVYYCIDNFAVSSAVARKVRSTEERLIAQSDLVFVTAQELYNRCSKYNRKVYTFPFGVNIRTFEQMSVGETAGVEDIDRLAKPVIGYVGGIHKWLDQELIAGLAKLMPQYSFAFIGPLQTDVSRLSGIPNIYFLGYKEHNQLPQYISRFTAGIIPYLLTEYTRNVYPTKLNEYLALGKPVVSTRLAEVEAFNGRHGNIVSMAENAAAFAGALEQIAGTGQDEQAVKRRKEVARDNNWEKKIEQMSGLIEEAARKRQQNTYLRWKENLIDFYRAARRRLLKTVFLFLLAYLLFFHTSLVWFLAAPLKMSQPPRRADAIVVFGGGVGEGGSPGKSTIERARYAAELFKRGYADNIIFSSGYAFKYNDAENMKMLALAAGVPEERVVLEETANSTVENGKLTYELFKRYDWRTILLVSSPYNMRRAALVYKKLDKGLNVVYTPVLNPQFYFCEEGIKWEQIKAIVHEYLGIVYYWWKGYI